MSLRKPRHAVRFILDAKWKHIGKGESDPIRDMPTPTLYQIYAYRKRYECRAVALVYPQSGDFTSPLTARFVDGLKIAFLPFDVASPEESRRGVRLALRTLAATGSKRITLASSPASLAVCLEEGDGKGWPVTLWGRRARCRSPLFPLRYLGDRRPSIWGDPYSTP